MYVNKPYINYSPDVEAYMVANNYQRIDNSIMPEAMIYVRNGKTAVIFLRTVIEVKQADTVTGTKINNVLFQWQTVKKYDGFDGQNKFQLMMLLDFMGAISIKDITRELRAEINVDHFLLKTPLHANS